MEEKDIKVVRRMSGGEQFIMMRKFEFYLYYQTGREDVSNFKVYPSIIKALDKMGIKAELSGRNDLTMMARNFR